MRNVWFRFFCSTLTLIVLIHPSFAIPPADSPAPRDHFLTPQYGVSSMPLEESRVLPKARIEAIQYWSTTNWTKIVIQTNRRIPYIYGQLTGSPQKNTTYGFYVDLLDSQHESQATAMLEEKNSLMQRLNVTSFTPRITRLFMEFRAPITLKAVTYENWEQNIINLEFQRTHQPSLTTNTTKSPHPSNTRHVIIDPGHGGNDPGASEQGISEKAITLDIALKLKHLFLKRTSVQVTLTREKDQFLSKEQRAMMARTIKGDLFVSIHINANTDPKVHGIETYYLEATTNTQALELATRENAMSGEAVQQFNTILRDLLSLQFASHSNRLAHSIQTRLLQTLGSQYHLIPRDLGVKEAPFLILLEAEMPAALLEFAFITNPKENERLRNDSFLQATAEGIFNGIQDYFLNQ
ncbi:N-acetylmuramoyl-L-alanine amidase [Deltaproteobacteria bacterium TL4]